MIICYIILLSCLIQHVILLPIKQKHVKYCIIGADESGLQMAYFLQSYNLDYIILEKSSKIGYFYYLMPKHFTIPNINKRYTGSSNTLFNERFDWNSLLSDSEKLKFNNINDKLYPTAFEYYEYLNMFADSYNLKIQLNTNIVINQINISREIFYEIDNVRCEILIYSNIDLDWNYRNRASRDEEESSDCSNYESKIKSNKAVFISGLNSQIYQELINTSEAVTLFTINKLAFNTGLISGVRSNYLHAFDGYQLKSLDVVLIRNTMTLKSTSDKPRCMQFFLYLNKNNVSNGDLSENMKFSVNKNSYAIGSSLVSFHKSYNSAQFIIIGRYLVRYLIRYLLKKYEKIDSWPSRVIPIGHLIDFILTRINEASSLFRCANFMIDVYKITTNYSFVEIHEDVLTEVYEPNVANELDIRVGFMNQIDLTTYSYLFESERLNDTIETRIFNKFVHPFVYVKNSNINFMFEDDIYMNWMDFPMNYFPLYHILYKTLPKDYLSMEVPLNSIDHLINFMTIPHYIL